MNPYIDFVHIFRFLFWVTLDNYLACLFHYYYYYVEKYIFAQKNVNDQVINHGVPGKLMDDTIRVFKEFHAMSAKEKASECSKDPNRSCRFYTSSEKYATEEVHVWRDALTHPCHPLEEYIEFWPAKPTRYR